jgi:N-acetyl-anhydromuramyl-L-alanine amidase AmpD
MISSKINQIKTAAKNAKEVAKTIKVEPTKPIDKVYPERISSTPNCSGVLIPEGIVLHHSGGSFAGLEPWIKNAKSKVSYHTIVNTTGERVQMVPDNKKAWHAGVSEFNGKRSCNNFMLGIAVTGDTRFRDLTQDEIISVAQWCITKMKLYNFGIDQITTHEAITQIRKTNKKIDVSKKAFEQIMEAIRERM